MSLLTELVQHPLDPDYAGVAERRKGGRRAADVLGDDAS